MSVHKDSVSITLKQTCRTIETDPPEEHEPLPKTTHPRVIYTVPSHEMIILLARTVCQEMETASGEELNTPQSWNDLADFFEVVATLYAKQLNKSVDKKSSEG